MQNSNELISRFIYVESNNTKKLLHIQAKKDYDIKSRSNW